MLASFTLKVDPKNGGSEHFVLATEMMPPGDVIPTHRHPGADELLIIQTGTARVTLGDKVQEAHAGAIVFVPSGTLIGVENIGKEPINLVGVLGTRVRGVPARRFRVGRREEHAFVQADVEQLRKLHSHAVIYQ